VVFVQSELNLDTMQQCFSRGGSGYLLETILPEAFRDSLNLVIAGEKVFPSELAKLLPLLVSQKNNSAGKMSAEKSAEPGPQARFTAQERKILGCLVCGHSNKLIARGLYIAETTVKVHIKNLLRKTGLRACPEIL
jgi:two-component system nitrate/nitrite response regulator NarL